MTLEVRRLIGAAARLLEASRRRFCERGRLGRALFPRASVTSTVATLLFGAAGATLYAPQALAFEHQATFGEMAVYGAAPLPATLEEDVAAAVSRLSKAGFDAELPPVHVFLTQGGPRWAWLSLPARGAFGVTRPGGRHVVLNRTEDGLVLNGRTVGGTRPLTDVLAHEFVHVLIEREFGILGARKLDAQRVEGFADAVAGSSSLADEEADAMLARGERHPALPYVLARREAEAVMAADGDLKAWLRGR